MEKINFKLQLTHSIKQRLHATALLSRVQQLILDHIRNSLLD